MTNKPKEIPIFVGVSPVVIGAPGRSAYELAVGAGFDGSLEDWLASLRGDPGTGTSIKKYDFCPLIIGAAQATDFVADDASSIVSQTSLSSNNVAAPILSGIGVPFAMATGKATSGAISLQIPQNYSYILAVWHDGTINKSNISTVFNSPLPSNVGLLFASAAVGGSAFGSVITQAGGLNNALSDPTQTILTINNGNLETEAGIAPLDTKLFPYLTLLVTAPVDGSSALVSTLDFLSTLTSLSVDSNPIPEDAADFDILIISGLGQNGLPEIASFFGKDVQNDDWCMLYDNLSDMTPVEFDGYFFNGGIMQRSACNC